MACWKKCWKFQQASFLRKISPYKFCDKTKEKFRNLSISELILGLLSRFELETSSLPKAQREHFHQKTQENHEILAYNPTFAVSKNCRREAMAPCFFMLFGQPHHIPRGYARAKRVAYKRDNSHGTSFPKFANLSAGNCIERTHLWPRLMPNARQPPTPRPWRAPASPPSTTPL